MTSKQEYKQALKGLDKNTRVCIKYLEGLTEERFKLALKAKQLQQPQAPKVDFSKIESTLDSLQKQIDGLRPKVDTAYSFTQEHGDQEKYLKKLTKDAEEVLNGMIDHFKELYDSGYYREGMKRKFRDEGLIRSKAE